MSTATVIYRDGWYDWEYDDYFPFRWMCGQSEVVLPAETWQGCRYVSLPISADDEQGRQTLTIAAGSEMLSSFPLLHRWHVYDLELPSSPGGAPNLALTLRLDRLMPASMHPGDTRELGVRIGALEPHNDARRHKYVTGFYKWGRKRFIDAAVERRNAQPVANGVDAVDTFTVDGGFLPAPAAGWFPWQFDGPIPFRWMSAQASVRVPGAVSGGHRFFTVPVSSERDDLSQTLTLSRGDDVLLRTALLGGWQHVTLPMPRASVGVELRFQVSETLAGADTTRVRAFLPRGVVAADGLGLRIGPIQFHDDEPRYDQSRAFLDNAARNNAEFESGTVNVTSFPLMLGIDLYAKCNIKPHCVYCLWDGSKEMEGDAVNTVVDARTLEEYGPFFDSARRLTNCSIGEPFLHPQLGDILDLVGRRQKMVDLATNGQAFTPASIEALAGKPVVLCVSLDAACAETYRRLRNERWHEVIVALTYLGDVRRHGTGLPLVNMVFMPMQANLQDLEGYFKLCRMVGGEGVMLRPLFNIGDRQIVEDRAGYHFDYARELLTDEEMEEVVERCSAYSKKYHVVLFNQFDFGLETGRSEGNDGKAGGGNQA